MVTLRRTLWLPLEDLLVVTREFVNENASRSAVHRLLQRYGRISRIPAEAKPQRPTKPFKAYDPGYLHADVKYLPQMADEDKRRYLFGGCGGNPVPLDWNTQLPGHPPGDPHQSG